MYTNKCGRMLIKQGLQWQKDKKMIQYNCPSIRKWINKIWHCIHQNHVINEANKKTEMGGLVKTWKNHNLLLQEKSK